MKSCGNYATNQTQTNINTFLSTFENIDDGAVLTTKDGSGGSIWLLADREYKIATLADGSEIWYQEATTRGGLI